MRPVEVEWLDSVMLRFGWQEPAEYQDEFSRPYLIRSVGYIVKRTKRELVLVMSWSENGQVGDGLAIPRACVRKITRLRGPSGNGIRRRAGRRGR